MSTQDAEYSVPITYSYDQAPVRLLELPPSLLSLIENATKSPSSEAPVLKIKAPPSTSTAPQNTVLCTPTETYQIRHVQTSNALFLLRPCIVPDRHPDDVDNEEDEGNDEVIPGPGKAGMAISSTCGSYLELLPSKPNSPSHAAAKEQLLSLLHTYSGPEVSIQKPDDALSKADIVKQIPLSDGEFQTTWEEIGGFEIDGWAMKLSATCCVKIFQEVVRGAVENGVKIFVGGGAGLLDIVGAMDPDEGWPEEAAKVVIRATAEEIKHDDGSVSWRVEPTKATTWIGKAMLVSDEYKGKKITIATFLDGWKKSLPEECQDLVNMELIKLFYNPKDPNSVQLLDFAAISATTVTAAEPVSKPATAPKGGAQKTEAKASARKWHDRFRK